MNNSFIFIQPDNVNKTLLFGNIRDINDISRRLLNLLEYEYTKSQQGDDGHCCIGQVFNGLIDQLKNVYAEYCRNHAWVHAYLRKVISMFFFFPENME